MNIFKRNKIKTSNDYYEAYKSEIGRKVEKKGVFTFSNILKVEIAAFAIGLFIMNQNNISLNFKTEYITGNNSLPVSIQSYGNDDNLVVTLEEEKTFPKLEIREETLDDMINSDLSMDAVYAENEEMKLLIESLKSEIKQKSVLLSSNRIIISQNN